MAGKKGRSGRKKDPTNCSRYLNEKIEENWSDLVDTYIKAAIQKEDFDALERLVSRRIGKVKDVLQVPGLESLGANSLVKLWQLVEERRAKLGNIPQIEQGSQEEGSQDATE